MTGLEAHSPARPQRLPMAPATRHTSIRVLIGFVIFLIGALVLHEIHLNNLAYFVVTSESMEPTIHVGDKLLMIHPRRYRPGEIVVFERPDEPGIKLVKRIVALGPAEVAVEGGQLFIDGRRADPPQGATEPTDIANQSWKLDEGQVFVAGDNRPNSKDSRDYGPLPAEALNGVVRYRIKSGLHWEAIQ